MKPNKIIKLSLATICLLLGTMMLPTEAHAANNDVATIADESAVYKNGTVANVNWIIYEDGVLKITPRDGVSGSLFSMGQSYPWLTHSSYIKSVVVENGVKASSCQYMFMGLSNCKSMDLRGLDVSTVTDFTCMFQGCSSLTSLNMSTFDTSKAQLMNSMFNGCNGLSSIDLSNFNTSNVTNMMAMFNGCGFTSLNLSSFDTKNVTNMQAMFMGCGRLTSLDLSNFDTSNVTDMTTMFHYCQNLTSLNLSNFNTSNVTSFNNMFFRCWSLQSITFGDWDTQNVTNMMAMFNECSALTELDLSKFNTAKVTNMSKMFYGCSKLQYLRLDNFDTSSVTNMENMFSISSPALNRIVLGHKFTFVGTSHAFNASAFGSNWVKTHNAEGTQLNDDTIYTASEIATKTNATSPTIAGTWAKTATYPIYCNTISGTSLGDTTITKGIGTEHSISAPEKPGYSPLNSTSYLVCSTTPRPVRFVYRPIEYTITFDLNGGEGIENTTYNIETETFTLGTPAKENSTFIGWTGANGTEPEETVVIEKGSIGNIAYTANWKMDSYAIITYNAGSDGLFSADRTENVVVYEDVHTISSGAYEKPEPIDKSMVFAGWYTDIDCTDGNEFTIPAANTEITVYAKYMLVTDVDYTLGTKVIYNNDRASEAYTVTVPAHLAPSETGTITVAGTWASNRQLTVLADSTVTLTNSINSAETRTLDINFDGIFKTGSNVQSISATKDISVAPISNTIFGVWTGTFNYMVEMADIV